MAKESAAGGAGVWRIFTLIIVPMSRNGIVTILILSFVSIWNDYIYALAFLPQPERQTLTMALASARAEYAVSYGLLSAAAIMAIVPVFVFSARSPTPADPACA